MTTDTDLGALIARVEGATGPDREIDAAIAAMLCGGNVDVVGRYWKPGVRGWSIAPAYTASLDAALSLVPKGRPFDLGCEDDGQSDWVADLTCFAPKGSDDHSLYVRGATPALALVAAALRARAAGVDEKEMGA